MTQDHVNAKRNFSNISVRNFLRAQLKELKKEI